MDTAAAKQSVVMSLCDLRGGGAERVVVDLLNHWPRDRFRPVLLLAEQCGPYLDDLDSSIEVLSCDLPFTAFNTPRALPRIRRLLDGVQPAAVFAHSIEAGRMLARAQAVGMLGAPLLWVVHANINTWLAAGSRGRLARWLIRRELGWILSRASGVIAVSKGAATEIEKRFPREIPYVETIHNPIDFDRLDAAVIREPDDPFVRVFAKLRRPVVLTVGRMCVEKNQALLLNAYARLPRDSRGSLVILGEGPLRPQLDSLAAELGISGETLFPGFLRNPWWYMQRSDLFVLSSRSEAYPTVLVEALACGLPVIATDCRHGPAEIIQSESFGTLVPLDDPDTLAAAIGRALESRREGSSLPGDVRVFLDAHRPEVVAQRYDQLFSALQGRRT